MERSPEINELAAALAKAQASIEGAAKSNINPAFKSKYADLASVWDACRGPLTANGLSVAQLPSIEDGGRVAVRTMLLHASGQYVAETLSVVPVKTDPQGVGSAITYLRRYGLSAMVGVAPDDDDGNAASGTRTPPPAQTRPMVPPAPDPGEPPAGYDEWLSDLTVAADTGLDTLGKVWAKATPEFRKRAGMATLDRLKTRAGAAV